MGYPTQKPILLLKQIIKLVTDENDIVLDPFMRSGTTLVGSRMESMIKTESYLLKKGKSAHMNLSESHMNILKSYK